MSIKEFKVEKSKFPEGDKKWLVVMYSKTGNGTNYQRVFKGTKQECEEEQKKRTEEYKKWKKQK